MRNQIVRATIFLLLINFVNEIVSAQSSLKMSVAMFKNDPQLTGVSNEPPVYKLDGIKFLFKANGSIRSTPVINNGTIFFGCGDGNFYAIDDQSGKERWKFKTGGAVHSSPAITNSIVYFASRDHYVYALKAGTGNVLWKFKMGEDVGKENYWDNYLSSPVIVGTTLFVGSGDGYMYAINANTGKLIWKYNAGARIRTTPAVSGSHVVFGTNAGLLIDVNASTGSLQWKFVTDGASNTFESKQNDRTSIYCSPSISNNIIITGGRDGIIYAVDLITGKEKWRNDHKGPWILSAAIKDGVAYVGCGSDFILQALDLKTGIEKWRCKVPSAIFSSLTIADNMIYFTDINFSGNVHAVDINNGKEKWDFPIGCKSFSTPVLSNGIVYCGAENGFLYALQGNKNADTTTINSKKFVYWEGAGNGKGFSYFATSVDDYIKNYFINVGYQLVNATQLEEIMKQQSVDHSHSVIVFADNRFPQNITDERSGKPLVRKYLDAAGKIVLLGLNPAAYIKDTSGIVIALDDSIPGAVFGLRYSEKKFFRGIYEVHPTKEGEKCGLYSNYTGFSNFTVIDPDQSIKILATDEFGSTTEWIKNYGGPQGSGLLQLWIPTNELSINLSEIRTVIEYGISW